LQKVEKIETEISRLEKTTIKPTEDVNKFLTSKGTNKIASGVKLIELLKRTEISYEDLKTIDPQRPELSKQEAEQVEIQVKYEGYIKLQIAQIEKFKKLENKKLPTSIDYLNLKGISLEAKQKLNQLKPTSIGQASRISGVSPADVSVLLIYLEQQKQSK